MQNLSSSKIEKFKDWYSNLHPAIQEQFKVDMIKKISVKMEPWPKEYKSSESGKVYIPHNEEERFFVYSDTPKNMLLKGGEGGGKSVAGTIKNLERLRRGMNGIMLSPDLEHFKKSLWPEFKRWCPIHRLIERHQYRFEEGWEPSSAFTLIFVNELGGYSSLICGGIKESEAISWEGPNVSFAHFDEARRHRTAIALKTLSGRVRIPGPNNEPPQIYFTTTPRKHWLFEYFGPVIARCKNCNAQYEIINNEETSCPECGHNENTIEDENLNFKRNSFVATVLTEENKDNLSEDFTQERGESLNESEKRILLLAEWEDETDTEKFIQSSWWKQCEEDLPPLSKNEPGILVLDASKGGSSQLDYDVFGLVIVTRHPADNEKVAVRYVNFWKPPPKGLLDYAPIELEVRKLCTEYSIIEVAYDPWQLHDMCTRLKLEKFAFFREFPQGKSRELADKRLQDVIMSRRIAYDKITGYHELARHLDNADYKKDSKGAIRLVKRKDTLKIDLAVCLSMGVDRAYYYNI